GNVTVKVYQKEHAVYIDIQDEGIGIPNEALGQLFTKFYRVDIAIAVMDTMITIAGDTILA
ncbi:ATP-binding protein, partial [Priestia aryabhattai]|uniref:ATP-binding protein n=1 Tax=Priestia aryabhattai TaxID=412384 RepID=UPI0015F6D945